MGAASSTYNRVFFSRRRKVTLLYQVPGLPQPKGTAHQSKTRKYPRTYQSKIPAGRLASSRQDRQPQREEHLLGRGRSRTRSSSSRAEATYKKRRGVISAGSSSTKKKRQGSADTKVREEPDKQRRSKPAQEPFKK